MNFCEGCKLCVQIPFWVEGHWGNILDALLFQHHLLKTVLCPLNCLYSLSKISKQSECIHFWVLCYFPWSICLIPLIDFQWNYWQSVPVYKGKAVRTSANLLTWLTQTISDNFCSFPSLFAITWDQMIPIHLRCLCTPTIILNGMKDD